MALVATIAFGLLLTSVYLIARPYLIPQLAVTDEAQLREEQARLRGQLHDLEMEFSTGKLAEIEYTTQRELREADLAVVDEALGDFDDLEVEPFDDDELERLIAQRRDAMAGATCPSCGTPTDPDDRFCRSCGADLTEVISR